MSQHWLWQSASPTESLRRAFLKESGFLPIWSSRSDFETRSQFPSLRHEKTPADAVGFYNFQPLPLPYRREHNDARETRDDPSLLLQIAPQSLRPQAPFPSWNRAMPLPMAEEGIAGLLQRSENRRISVSPNDSPGTAKRRRWICPISREGKDG